MNKFERKNCQETKTKTKVKILKRTFEIVHESQLKEKARKPEVYAMVTLTTEVKKTTDLCGLVQGTDSTTLETNSQMT